MQCATISDQQCRTAEHIGTAQIIRVHRGRRGAEGRSRAAALIVTGEGERAFIGGANLFELGALNPAKARDFLTLIHRMCKVLRDLPVPVIARVNGFCLGAGLEVMAACDMHIASDNALFGMPEVKIGLPSVVEAALLPQLIGWGRTKVLLYTGDNIDASTALDWGSGGAGRSGRGAGCCACGMDPRDRRVGATGDPAAEGTDPGMGSDAGQRCDRGRHSLHVSCLPDRGTDPHGQPGDPSPESTQGDAMNCRCIE